MVAKIEVPGRLKVFGPVLLCVGFPGLANGFVALWDGFWGAGSLLFGALVRCSLGLVWCAESEFEVRFSKFGRLGLWGSSTFRAFALLSSLSRSSVTYRDGICVRQNLGLQKSEIKTIQTAQKSYNF